MVEECATSVAPTCHLRCSADTARNPRYANFPLRFSPLSAALPPLAAYSRQKISLHPSRIPSSGASAASRSAALAFASSVSGGSSAAAPPEACLKTSSMSSFMSSSVRTPEREGSDGSVGGDSR